MANPNNVQVVASDAGGTMTDMVIVDREGNFSIGKAATTPKDQSIGFWESVSDAFEHWEVDFDKECGDILPTVDAIVYSGTSMLNVLLTGTGLKVGAIVQRGNEDALMHDRSRQTYAGYAYQDVLHHVTHQHTEPLVPRHLVKGVTGRIDMFGQEVIPLYEHEARSAVEQLIDENVEAIAVCLWFSYLNPMHELRVGQIAEEVMKEKGRTVPIYVSHQVAPIMREHSRLNSVVLQSYTVDPGRKQLLQIEEKLKGGGYPNPLQIVLAHGGLANIRYPRLYEACFGAPAGGLMGAQYLSEKVGHANWICSDMGGTSFDTGLIMGGQPLLQREVVLARRLFNIPTLVMDSIGAGTGQYVTIDPLTNRVLLGPDSAGADPGPVCYGMGNEIPTITDCDLILGILNPDNYLGGKVKLDTDAALRAIKEKCSDRLDVDPYYFAEGVYKLINSTMKEHLRAVLNSRGFSAADYCLLGYGGAGPVHLAGYSEGLPFNGVVTMPWAAGFSSFGCAAVDITHRHQKSTQVIVPYGAADDFKMMMGQILNMSWDELEQQSRMDLATEGFNYEQAEFKPIAYVRYGGQIDDLEVVSPVQRIQSPADMDRLIDAFEELYSRIYAGVAKYETAGYHILEVGLMTTIPKAKPNLVRHELGDPEPPKSAMKEEREVYVNGQWQRALIYDMDQLRPGNKIQGLAVIEAPATTFFIPPERQVHMDEWSLLWLS